MKFNISYEEIKHYRRNYSEYDSKSILNPDEKKIGFWTKIRESYKLAGKEVIYKALLLYYAAKSKSNKGLYALIFGALGYFIFQVDLVPDIIPVVGFTDDLIVLNMVLNLVYICDEMKKKALGKLWFLIF
jgi:uncharacterized membrane protein YkvA (DUF1232 family)